MKKRITQSSNRGYPAACHRAWKYRAEYATTQQLDFSGYLRFSTPFEKGVAPFGAGDHDC